MFTTVIMVMLVVLVVMVVDGRLLTLHYSRIISVGSVTGLLGVGIQLIRPPLAIT